MTEHSLKTENALPASPLARLRLLVALDALLVAGSVSGAARMLEVSPPAMSRLLAQLRVQFDDPILIRSGQTMVPTPMAGALRARVRTLSIAADALLNRDLSAPVLAAAQPKRPAAIEALHQPDLMAAQIRSGEATDSLAPTDPRALLARHVATVGGGPGRARPLTMDEAKEAFRIILEGNADPVQIGALMIALQCRGTTADELAGMVMVARQRAAYPGQTEGSVDLDWPAYLSPRNRRVPFFLLAARCLAAAGYRVLLHGYAQGIPQFGGVLDVLGIPVAQSRAQAIAEVRHRKIAFLPLTGVAPQMQALIGLYQMFDMRSPINLVVSLLNPLGARATVLGVPSSGVATLYRDAARLIGQNRLLCVESNRDVAQASPHRALSIRLSSGAGEDVFRVAADTSRTLPGLLPGYGTVDYCAALWEGRLREPDAEAMVTDTVAIALSALGQDRDFGQARERARALWQNRLDRNDK